MPPERQHRAITAAGLASACVLVLGGVALGPSFVRGASPEPTSPSVQIVDFAFEPADLTVAQHTAVIWTNTSDQDHSVVQQDSFDSGTIGPGEAFGHVFDDVGRWMYRCSFHPDRMQGSVTVTAVEATPTASVITPPPGTLPPDFSPKPPPTASTSANASGGAVGSSAVASPSSGADGSTGSGGVGPATLGLGIAILAVIGGVAVVMARRRPTR